MRFMKRLVERIEVETFAHATESLEKVMEALERAGVPSGSISVEKTKGHYGNDINVLRANISRSAGMRVFFDSSFFSNIKSEILNTLPERVDDKGFLYLRMDKQDLFNGIYRLNDRGDVRVFIKILAYPSKREKVIENAKELFGHRPEGDKERPL